MVLEVHAFDFKCTGRVNYSIEAFTLLSQYHFLLSKCQASQLIWGRFINTRGLPCHNIPCNLFIEHLNRICKDAINGLKPIKLQKHWFELAECWVN